MVTYLTKFSSLTSFNSLFPTNLGKMNLFHFQNFHFYRKILTALKNEKERKNNSITTKAQLFKANDVVS